MPYNNLATSNSNTEKEERQVYVASLGLSKPETVLGVDIGPSDSELSTVTQKLSNVSTRCLVRHTGPSPTHSE